MLRDLRGGLVGLACYLALTSCVAPAHVGEYPNQQRVMGQSKPTMLACAGTPTHELTERGTTSLLYYREAPVFEASRPIAKGSFSTVRHGCWATVIMIEDHIVDVQYRFVPPTFDASNDCEAIFDACVK
jgi:hypothetical protein